MSQFNEWIMTRSDWDAITTLSHHQSTKKHLEEVLEQTLHVCHQPLTPSEVSLRLPELLAPTFRCLTPEGFTSANQQP